MEQNQMILLVAILAIVVVVIIAAVMMGGGGSDTTTPPAAAPSTGTPSTGTPSTGTPSTGTPSTGTPSTGGTVNVNDEVIAAMSSGQPVTCTMTMDSEAMYGDPSMAGYDTTMTMEIKGMKGRAEIVSAGMTSTVITDGTTSYINMPVIGDVWYLMTAEDMGTEAVVKMPTAEEIKESLSNVPDGVSLECHISPNVSESDFQLPAGATVKNYEDMYSDMLGSGNISS